MLNQDTDETLNRTKYNTMDHDRTMLLSISSDIFAVKSHWQLEVKLDRTTLPCSSNRIFQMEINLRTIECSVSFIYRIGQTQIIQSTLKCCSRHIPIFVTSHGILRPCGKFYMIFKSKQLVYFIDQLCNAFDLVTDLLRHHKDMGIILCKATYTHQAMKLTGFLMTMDKTKLTHTQWQIPVRTWF